MSREIRCGVGWDKRGDVTVEAYVLQSEVAGLPGGEARPSQVGVHMAIGEQEA